jgi:hypothetical protein
MRGEEKFPSGVFFNTGSTSTIVRRKRGMQKYPARKQNRSILYHDRSVLNSCKAIFQFELPENTTSKWTAQVNETTNRIPGEFELGNRPRGSEGESDISEIIGMTSKERQIVIDRDSMEKFQSPVTKKSIDSIAG